MSNDTLGIKVDSRLIYLKSLVFRLDRYPAIPHTIDSILTTKHKIEREKDTHRHTNTHQQI